MQSEEITRFIHEQKDLFWFVPEEIIERISDAVLVETILNYGSLDAVRSLIGLMGLESAARIFASTAFADGRRQNNYHELTRHYYFHVFKRYAPKYFKQRAD